jgi:cation/acetate symporter
MAATSRTRLVNPRLGTYFGIFAAAFVSLALMALMLEQLGVSERALRYLMFAGPIAFYGAIGLLSPTREVNDYFTSGRRVPAFFNGLVLAVTALGGSGFLALTGVYFAIGFDALCLGLGLCAGLVFMGVLLAPFLRKFGAYTIPSYLGRRFESRMLRVVAAAVLAVPLLLLLAAEARFASYAAAWLTGQHESVMAIVVVTCASAMVIGGGMRSHTWSGAAKAIVALVALAVPATIVALMLSSLPLPQMTHGNTLRVLTRLEGLRGLPDLPVSVLAVELPGVGLEPLTRRFIQAFGSVGSLAFVLMALVTMAGVAASPVLLSRPGSTPSVHETRKSLGWAVLIVAFVMLTLPAVAIYLRLMLLDQVVGQPADRLPAWFDALQKAAIARAEGTSQTIAFVDVSFDRDAVLFSLSYAARLPQSLAYLAIAGAFAAALAALAAALVGCSSLLSEDVVHGLRAEVPPDGTRVGSARVAVIAVAAVTGWLGAAAPADPLKLFLWSLSFSAAAAFPVLLLSVWWRRTNAWGAAAGLLAGLTVTALAIFLSESGAWALPSVLAGALGLPAGMAAAIIASVLTPAPSRHIVNILQEIRVPGGETLYDREQRLLRLRSRAPV